MSDEMENDMNIDESTPNDKHGMSKIPDPNPDTYLNEDLWRTFFFHFLAYMAPIIFGSVILIGDNVTGWNWGKFFFGMSMIIIPLFSATSRAQAYNKRNQAIIKKESEQIAVNKEYEDRIEIIEKDNDGLKIEYNVLLKESYEVKAKLDAACQTIAANKVALVKADDHEKLNEKVDTAVQIDPPTS